MEITLEVVHSIIRLQLKNHENTLSTSGVLLILLKIALRKISKSPLTFNLKIMVSQKNNHYGQNILPILIIFLL